MHRGALRRLGEVDGLHRALLRAFAAERARVQVDGADHAAVVELGEDGLLARLRGIDRADRLAGAAVDAVAGDDVGQAADADLEVARVPADRLDGGAAPDVEVGVVDGHVAVEALAGAGLRVGGGQALAAVVGGEHGADAGGAAAEERPPLDELDVVTHLGEFRGGLRAGHAAADDHHGVVALGVADGVGRRVGVGDRRADDAGRLVGHGGRVVAVHPAAALADVGDVELAGRAPEACGSGARRSLASSRRRPAGACRRPPGARASGPGPRGRTSGSRAHVGMKVRSPARAGRSRRSSWCRRTRRGARAGAGRSFLRPLPAVCGAVAGEVARAALGGGPSSAAAPRWPRPGSRARRCRSPGTSRRRRRWCGARSRAAAPPRGRRARDA